MIYCDYQSLLSLEKIEEPKTWRQISWLIIAKWLKFQGTGCLMIFESLNRILSLITFLLTGFLKFFLKIWSESSTKCSFYFHSQVSLGMKKLKRGGTPSLPMAAKYVLNNWYSGKIRFFTQTPDQEQPRPDHVTPEVVEEHAKDFRSVFYWNIFESVLLHIPDYS